MNLDYIRAAIKENTGVDLTRKQTAQYLIEENLAKPKQLKRALHFSYLGYYDGVVLEQEEEATKEPSFVSGRGSAYAKDDA